MPSRGRITREKFGQSFRPVIKQTEANGERISLRFRGSGFGFGVSNDDRYSGPFQPFNPRIKSGLRSNRLELDSVCRPRPAFKVTKCDLNESDSSTVKRISVKG